MIQITEEKKEKLSEMCDKMLHYGGKMMQCLESLDEDGEEMGMREYPDDEDMGYRRGGGRMGMRGDSMGYRRGRDSMGRYARY